MPNGSAEIDGRVQIGWYSVTFCLFHYYIILSIIQFIDSQESHFRGRYKDILLYSFLIPEVLFIKSLYHLLGCHSYH